MSTILLPLPFNQEKYLAFYSNQYQSQAETMIFKGWNQLHRETLTTKARCQPVGMPENRFILCLQWPQWCPVKRKVKLATIFVVLELIFPDFFSSLSLSSELQNSSLRGRPRLTVGCLGFMEWMFTYLWRRGFIFTETLPEQQVSGWMLFTYWWENLKFWYVSDHKK